MFYIYLELNLEYSRVTPTDVPKSEEKTVAEFTHEDVKKASEHFEGEIEPIKSRCGEVSVLKQKEQTGKKY